MTTVSTQWFSSCWYFFVTECYLGGMDLYVQEFGQNKTHDEFYTDLNIRAQFNNFVQFIVARYANEPTVMAWELANDPRCNSSTVPSASWNTNTVTQWDADESRFVKSIDPNHLVTSGYAHILSLSTAFLF